MEISEFRNIIDKIDNELVKLLESRMNAVLSIAELKKQQKLPILDASREQELLAKVASKVENPDFTDTVTSTFQDILKHSRAYQQAHLEK